MKHRNLKRALSVFLIAVLAAAFLPLFPAAHAVSQREAVLLIAEAELGYHEKASNKNLNSKTANSGTGNYTKYGAWYGMNPAAWCAIFVCWCANQAGLSTDVLPRFALCVDDSYPTSGSKQFKDMGRWMDRDYVPAPGDLIFLTQSHVGIVESVTDTEIHSIDGNWGDRVQRVTRPLGDNSIAGFGLPVYDESVQIDPETLPLSTDADEEPIEEQQSGGNKIKVDFLQRIFDWFKALFAKLFGR